MVYLREYIEKLRHDLLKGQDLTILAYHFASDNGNVDAFTGSLTGDEAIAAKGYRGKSSTDTEVGVVVSKKPYKGFGITDNIYKLIGIHLASGGRLEEQVRQKFHNSSLKSKYFISKCLPEYTEDLKAQLASGEAKAPLHTLLNVLLGVKADEVIQDEVLYRFVTEADDVADLLLLEDLEKYLLSQAVVRETFVNKSAKQLIQEVLQNFREANKKVTKDRRKDHQEYEINDEYDVQDLLYTILKSIFPSIKEEDPTPKVGIKSNKIDLILREKGILIEVKMIKEADQSEKKYVEELKNDIQSYHQCQWLQHLICFVYDPFEKIRSKQHFYDLNGVQSINGKEFEIDVIVG